MQQAAHVRYFCTAGKDLEPISLVSAGASGSAEEGTGTVAESWCCDHSAKESAGVSVMRCQSYPGQQLNYVWLGQPRVSGSCDQSAFKQCDCTAPVPAQHTDTTVYFRKGPCHHPGLNLSVLQQELLVAACASGSCMLLQQASGHCVVLIKGPVA